jgi:sulfite exporter TauE/SafE
MNSQASIYGVLFLSGLLGSLGHCLGMCGPLVLMVGLQLEARGWAGVPVHALYHATRVAVYVVLGAIVGEVGSLLGLSSGFYQLAGAVSLTLGLGIVLVGVGYLGWLPLGRLEGAGAWLNRAMSQALRLGNLRGVLLLGALNGLLPCGLVYSSLLLVASTGSAGAGALGMLAFGLGTIPALLVVGAGSGSLSARVRQAMSRVAGVLIVLVGLQLILRGAAALGWTSHLHLGQVMLW